MNMSPTLKALVAQTIVNKDILTDDIPLQLQEEIHTLKKVKQFQQDIKYNERMYDLLQNILEQIVGDIDDYGNERIKYFRECVKWFKNAEYKVIGMNNDNEDELESVQNSLPSEYRNIIFIISEIASDDMILESIYATIENLINEECRKLELFRTHIAETFPDGNEKEVLLIDMFEFNTLHRKLAMKVLDYKLY